SYVWALAPAPGGGAVYAATGPNGRVYRVTADGKASVFYETKQDHVLCLAAAPDGQVYAGTDKTGRVYRIDPNGQAFVLCQAPQAEVRTLLLTDGVLYAGTSATKKRGGSSGGGDSASKSTARVEKAVPARTASREEKAVKLAEDKPASKGKEKASGS